MGYWGEAVTDSNSGQPGILYGRVVVWAGFEEEIRRERPWSGGKGGYACLRLGSVKSWKLRSAWNVCCESKPCVRWGVIGWGRLRRDACCQVAKGQELGLYSAGLRLSILAEVGKRHRVPTSLWSWATRTGGNGLLSRYVGMKWGQLRNSQSSLPSPSRSMEPHSQF